MRVMKQKKDKAKGHHRFGSLLAVVLVTNMPLLQLRADDLSVFPSRSAPPLVLLIRYTGP